MSTKMNEHDIIERLLQAGDPPQKTVEIPRLGVAVTLKALTAKEIYRLREEYTHRKEKRGQVIETFDEEGFHTGLVVAATVTPNWGDQRLMTHFQASEPAEVVKRVLLAGELAQLADVVLDLSGYNTDLREVKN
ncbi:MAG TPA: hypothetical protein VIK69_00795 [Methylophilaceae bacterium]